MFYLIPVKAKWLAWFDGVFFVWTVVQAFLPSYGGTYSSYRASAFAAVVSLLNFLIFYFSTRNYAKISPKQQKRRREFKKQDAKKRAKSLQCTAGRTGAETPLCCMRQDQSWITRNWNSDIVPNATETMSIVRITYLHTNM